MSVVRQIDCPNCGAEGKISLKGNDYTYEDISTCPVCGAVLVDEDDEESSSDE